MNLRGMLHFSPADCLHALKPLRPLIFLAFCGSPLTVGAGVFPDNLFNYQESPQSDIRVFSQWVDVLEKQVLNDVPSGDCTAKTLNVCHLQDWLGFLEEIRHLPPEIQLAKVNRYANRKSYVLDADNYGTEDYWAIPTEFFLAGGDCEDFAITKLFSLRWLGFPVETLRIVVLQDTNLRTPHAVLAVASAGDIVILDNQTEEIVSHSDIGHYAPVYSINEQQWWIHLPNSGEQGM